MSIHIVSSRDDVPKRVNTVVCGQPLRYLDGDGELVKDDAPVSDEHEKKPPAKGGRRPFERSDSAHAHAPVRDPTPAPGADQQQIFDWFDADARKPMQSPVRPMQRRLDAKTLELEERLFRDEGPSLQMTQRARRAVDSKIDREFAEGAAKTYVKDRLADGQPVSSIADSLDYAKKFLQQQSADELVKGLRGAVLKLVQHRHRSAGRGLSVDDVHMLRVLLNVPDDEIRGLSDALKQTKGGPDLLNVMAAYSDRLRAHFSEVAKNLAEGASPDVKAKTRGFINDIASGKTVSVNDAMDSAHRFLLSSGVTVVGDRLRQAVRTLKDSVLTKAAKLAPAPRVPDPAVPTSPSQTMAPPPVHAKPLGGFAQYDDLDVIFRAVDAEILRLGDNFEIPDSAIPFMEDCRANIRMFIAVANVMKRT